MFHLRHSCWSKYCTCLTAAHYLARASWPLGIPPWAAMPGMGNSAFNHLCCSRSLSLAPSGPGRRGPFPLPKKDGRLLLGRTDDCKMQAFLYSAKSHLSLQVEMDSFEWITVSYCSCVVEPMVAEEEVSMFVFSALIELLITLGRIHPFFKLINIL